MSAALRLCEALNSGDVQLSDHEGTLKMLAQLLRPVMNPTEYKSRSASGAEPGSTTTLPSPPRDPTACGADPAGGG